MNRTGVISSRGEPEERFRPMANCKAYLIAAMLLCLPFVPSLGDACSVAPSSPEQEREIQRLKAKVASLEDEIDRRNEETLQLETVVRERTAQTVALVAELDVLQVNVADDGSVMKASTQNVLLEQQTERLGSDLEDQVRKGELLEVRATEAEKSSQELRRKLESFEKTNLEQKKEIQELDGKLQRAQAKLAELEKEAKIKADEELAKVPEPRARVVLEPYLKPVACLWRRLVASSSLYRGQVQESLRDLMQGNEVLKQLWDDRLTWFAAFALLAVPVFTVYKIVTAAFRKRARALKQQGDRRSRSSALPGRPWTQQAGTHGDEDEALVSAEPARLGNS